MFKYLLIFLPIIAYSQRPYHCSPNPPDGIYYVDGVLYDTPKPKDCYSVMKPDGTVINKNYLVFSGDKFIEDTAKKEADELAEKQAQQSKRAQIQALKDKLENSQDLTNIELRALLKELIKRLQ